MITIKLLVAITWLPFIVNQDNIGNYDHPNLDPTVEDDNATDVVCKMRDGRMGICVHERFCSKDYIILPGADIEDSELRSLSDNCAGRPNFDYNIWCCSPELIRSAQPAVDNTNNTSNSSGETDDCQPLKDDRCPWCVKLYKVSDSNKMDRGAFCIGSLIGPNIILTSAYCLKAGQNQTLYAQIPTSANPDLKYIVRDRKLHPQYNTGTHWFDFGIIVLEDDVNWGDTPAKRACLKFELIGSDRNGGDCFTLGYNTKDEFVSTILEVTKGRCSNLGGGGSNDVFCGKSTDDLCFAFTGAPVICESALGFVMQGIVRSNCVNDNVLIGSLTYAVTWINKELEAMNVTKEQPKPAASRSNNQNACQSLDSDKCPWCVKLFKVSEINDKESDAFCIGSLIGSNIILTAASCLKAEQNITLYARILTSANPKHKYIVKDQKLHPQYNTGTHSFDYGIVVLDEDVNWGVTPVKGACLNFESISGKCFTLGYNTEDEFVSTILTVSRGPCNDLGGGGSPGVSCGKSSEDQCFAYPGAPVICETSSGGLALQGVVQAHCSEKNVLLGNLDSITSWVTTELEKLYAPKQIYTQN